MFALFSLLDVTEQCDPPHGPVLGAEVALEVDGTDEIQLSPTGLPAQGNNFKGGQPKNQKRKNKNKKLPTARLHRISHDHHASICGDLVDAKLKVK